MIKRAIISVSDKTGIVELATRLHELGVEILSTGGTTTAIEKAGIPVIAVSDVTGYPECLDGRVKTLHPAIHGGILAMRSNKKHMKKLKELDITPIDLVVINLYPFKKTVAIPDVVRETCIENIDIGGPGMLRAAAKNHADVTVVTDPDDYAVVLEELAASGDTSMETRFRLAAKVFEETAAYDALIADYFLSEMEEKTMPRSFTPTFDMVQKLRYGENPHQQAWLYRDAKPFSGSLPMAEQLNGKELSYNNFADTDAAISILKEFDQPTVVAVKHANPCGVGSADTLLEAWNKAFDADPVSIFGGIVVTNREMDAETVTAMKPVFLEVVVAPSFTPEALELLKAKKNLRVLLLPDVAVPIPENSVKFKKILGGLLVQDEDTTVMVADDVKTITETEPDPSMAADLVFAMKVVKHVKSNGIVLVKNLQTVGIGPGQLNRIGAVNIAVAQAGEKAKDSIMGSDAFFPFRDCVDAAAKAGVKAIIQPGGSIRDTESIDACNEHKIAMLMTGMRHFKH